MVYFSIPGQSFYKESRNQSAIFCFLKMLWTQENKQTPQVCNFSKMFLKYVKKKYSFRKPFSRDSISFTSIRVNPIS